jgi:hypothetical protein
MEAEQTQLFNQKLSQWIASQGFWFQLRHSMSGGGDWSLTMHHLMRLGVKMLVALLLATGGFGIYLVQRVKTGSFKESLNSGLARGLGATEAKVVDFDRTQGIVQIKRIAAEGGEESFFRNLDAGNLRLKMGLLAGIAGAWDAGTLQAKWMEIDLKAGADSPEAAAKQGASFFREWDRFRFSSLEVDLATVSWGFSPRTQGRIERSHLLATRGTDRWRLEFRGGTLTQNWLRKLEIVELIVDAVPGGLEVIKGEFKVGGGSVFLRDVKISGGDQPVVSGAVEISKAELASFLPDPAKPLVEGVISGTFALSGSTNSAEGLQLEGDVTLGGGNLIAIREKLPLLNTLSLKDLFNSYHRVEFDRGSFRLKTGGGAMELSRVDLKAGELMTAQGRILMRFPSDDELTAAADVKSDFAPLIRPGRDSAKDGKDDRAVELSLEKAALADKAEKEKKGAAADMALFERGNQRRINDLLLQQEIARRARALRCEPGSGLRITIPGDAFDRTEALREAYPVDPSSGRIAINVPLQGALHELTFQQAKEMLELGQRQ